jgi:probable rRNA maturation factor
MNPSKNIHIEFDGDPDEKIDLPRLEELIRTVCVEFNVFEVRIQISLVNDAQMIEVHQQFLDQDTTTDVMSFDLTDEFEDVQNFQLVVNLDMARRQASERGHSVLSELALYITHGLLHQMGYDDHEPEAARHMHEKEDAILQSLGFGSIYHNRETNQEE